ncbi:hypothetical protein QBC38DRAFT_357712 [Podospora fimiseda]|uniref:Rhodopsin domain-containing protein n=1 Tax=Podospora fimiseda TaxID=252190 RepID=A0AAN7BW86_9PEZI|nr:hypothetical protein QBC38DRAFT_357712 [Podospora fimiseda]
MPAIAVPPTVPASVEVYRKLATREFVSGSNQASVFIVGTVLSIVAVIVMVLRIYCRISITQGGLRVDDWLMLAGVVGNVGFSIANMTCAWYGAGIHVADRALETWLENNAGLFQSHYANRLLYVIALGLVKMSLLISYLRLGPDRWARHAIYFLMFTVIGLTLATMFVCIFECWPPSLYWKLSAEFSSLAAKKCMNDTSRKIFFQANGIINIVQDIGIYLLPIPILWKLQVPRRQKFAMLFLFSVGFVSLVAACIRVHYILKISKGEDIWYYFADYLNWCSIEVYAAIICGSASTFCVLFKTFAPQLWEGSWYNNGVNPEAGAQHPYNKSGSGSFALGIFGQANETRSTRSKRSKRGLTTLDNNSEEAIIVYKGELSAAQINGKNNGIIMNREFHMEIGTASVQGDEEKKLIIPESLRS